MQLSICMVLYALLIHILFRYTALLPCTFTSES
jgi:hypothetical protein